MAFPLNLRGKGRRFNPLTLFAAGEQGGWYDPSDFTTQFQDSAGTTPVTATGQPVGKVLDKSGRGNHLVQATAGNRPTLQQDASGFYYWSFDGVNDCWQSAVAMDLSSTSKFTLTAGVMKTSDVGNVLIELSVTSTATPGTFAVFAPITGTPATYTLRNSGAIAGIDATSAASYAAPSSVVLTGVGDTATNRTELRLNGAVAGSNGASLGGGNYTSQVLYVGARAATTTPFTGRLYGFIVRGALSTAAQIAATERHIGSKMGIALAGP